MPGLVSADVGDARSVVTVDGQFERRELNGIVDISTSSAATPDQLDASGFRAPPGRVIAAEPVTWLRIAVTNNSGDPLQLFLETGLKSLDEVRLWKVADGAVQQVLASGDDFRSHSLIPNHTELALPLELAGGEGATYLARLAGAEGEVTAELAHAYDFHNDGRLHVQYLISFAGFVIGLFLYKAFLFMGTRNAIYLTFAGYAGSLALYWTIRDGLAPIQYPGASLALTFDGPLAQALLVVAAGLVLEFVRQLFPASTLAPWLRRIFLGTLAVAVAVLFLPAALASTVASSVLLILAAGAAYVALRESAEAGSYGLLGALAAGLIPWIVLFGADFALTPASDALLAWGVRISLLVQLFAFSFALTAQIGRAERDTIAAQELAITAQREAAEAQEEAVQAREAANRDLEQQVAERTAELDNTYTQLRETQQQLVQSEKMFSIGQMIEGVSDEIVEPLEGIGGRLTEVRTSVDHLSRVLDEYQNLVRVLEDPDAEDEAVPQQFERVERLMEGLITADDIESLDADLGRSGEQLSSVAEVVGALRDFASGQRSTVDDYDLRRGVDTTLTVIRHLVRRHAVVRTSFEGVVPVRCNPSQINQVILNLLLNALEAIEASGERGLIRINAAVEGEYLVCRILDTGVGMDETVRSQVLEPFFTTKEESGRVHHGLGLTMVRDIVREHEGRLMMRSRPGKGTVVAFGLPITVEEDPALLDDDSIDDIELEVE